MGLLRRLESLRHVWAARLGPLETWVSASSFTCLRLQPVSFQKWRVSKLHLTTESCLPLSLTCV